MKEEIS